MALRNKDDSDDPEIRRLQRKRDQAWEMAGCARQDGDRADESRWTEQAREYQRQISELQR